MSDTQLDDFANNERIERAQARRRQAEVVQLRLDVKEVAELAADVLVLRAALQALYDATEVADVVYDVAVWDAARLAAGVVLSGDNG